MLSLQNDLIVLPTSRAIREYINQKKSTNQLLQKYIPIGDFFQRAVLLDNEKRLCDKNLKLLFLKESIKNIDIKKLGFSENFTTFVKQSEYIFRFFQELANEYVSFDELLEKDTYILYSDHIEILKQIYNNYCSVLDENGYSDNILLPSNFKVNSDYIDQFKTITIYIEGYLSSFELNVVKEVSQITQCKINFTLNRFNLKNIELFGLESEEYEEGYTYTIDFDSKKIIEKEQHLNLNQDITISPLLSKTLQIAFIKQNISKMIQSGIEPERIVVVVPNEQISSYLELFDNEHYFNFAMGKGISSSNIFQTLKQISKILTDYEPKDQHKGEFLSLDNEKLETLFKSNWDKNITKKLFSDLFDYLISLEDEQELILKVEQIKITLDVLLFSKLQQIEPISLKEFTRLLLNQLSTITIDDVNGGKITVMGILETRHISFDGVIVCDFNDDKIPKISVKDKFISTSLKEQVSLPTISDRENLQRYYYKKLFDNAQSLAICYVDDESSVMSRFITQLFDNHKKYIRKENFSSIIFNKRDIEHFDKEIILDIDLSSLTWSATSLKSYLTCKRQFYFQYIVKLKEHHVSLKPQSFEVGTIIHDALENMARDNKISYEYLESYLSNSAKNNPYLILELELWKKRLQHVITLEEKRASDGIKIHEVEKPFNIKYEGVELQGKIDRIDKYPDNTYEILDYKTSSSLKIDTIKSYEESKDFQLEFYYLANDDKMVRDVCYYDLSSCSIKNEVVLKEKLELLKIHLLKLKTKFVNFSKTDEKASCQFCTYQTICNI